MEIKEILQTEGLQLQEELEQMGETYLDRFKDHLKDVSEETKSKVNDRLKAAGRLHYKSLTASSEEKRADYAEASDIARMRAVTILKADAVVHYEEMASIIGESFKTSMELFSKTVTTVVKGVATGVISGALSEQGFKGFLKNLPNF